MAVPQDLQNLYDIYEEKLAKAYEKATVLSGAFGMGDDPRKSACNEIFFESVKEWCDTYCASNPDPDEAAEVVSFILSAAAQRREKKSMWYTYAAQQHCYDIIPLMKPEAAASIREQFLLDYPKLDRTPVQNEVDKRLKKAAGVSEQNEKTAIDLKMWSRRVIALLVGLTIAHLGVTLFLLADLGSDPFNVLIQGIFRCIPWGTIPMTHGTVHVIISLMIIVALWFIDRSYVRIGTFLCMILGGPIIDIFTALLGGIVNSGSAMAVRVIAVILGCGILAFGMTIVIKSEAGTGPNDLVAVVISDKRRWKFGIVRICVDVGFALMGFLLGGTVGVGTIICLAVVGPVAQIFMPFSERICTAFISG